MLVTYSLHDYMDLFSVATLPGDSMDRLFRGIIDYDRTLGIEYTF